MMAGGHGTNGVLLLDVIATPTASCLIRTFQQATCPLFFMPSSIIIISNQDDLVLFFPVANCRLPIFSSRSIQSISLRSSHSLFAILYGWLGGLLNDKCDFFKKWNGRISLLLQRAIGRQIARRGYRKISTQVLKGERKRVSSIRGLRMADVHTDKEDSITRQVQSLG